jgi:hypothetical protein
VSEINDFALKAVFVMFPAMIKICGEVEIQIRHSLAATVDCETAVQMHNIFLVVVPTRQLPLITR